jgi:pimeloyl-ACP methyl ester carboxylesterase
MDWLWAALFALGSLAALALLLWLSIRFSVRRLGSFLPYEIEERLPTADGSFIELRRLPPPDLAVSLPPVLLVHGLAANHRNQDLSEDLSLARFLRAHGRDVWLLTLRSALGGPRSRFDAMVKQDLPLGVREVLSRAGAERVDYVGFSMGGMLLYAAIAKTVAGECFRRVVIIGSPAVVRSPLRLPVPRVIGKLPAVLFPTMRLRWAARAGAFPATSVRTFAHRWVFNPDNVAPAVARAALVNVIEDVPGPLNLDFAAWAASSDGSLTYEGRPVLDGLGNLEIPVLFFAGGADLIAPPNAVRAAYDAWGSRAASVEKRFVLLSRAEGASADYGHGDLAVGANARAELFEPIALFLGDA